MINLDNFLSKKTVLFDLVYDIEKEIDLNSIVEQYAEKGDETNATTKYKSPFVEEDKGLSLYVHRKRNVFKCFITGKGGNVIDFLTYVNYGLKPSSSDYFTTLDQIVSDYDYNLNYINQT